MQLKIFFFPMALIGAAVISIWHVWPMYQESIDKKEVLAEKKTQLSQLEVRKETIDSLFATITNFRNESATDFLFRYIPDMPDDEYVINAINAAADENEVTLLIIDATHNGQNNFFGDSQVAQGNTDPTALNRQEIKKQQLQEFAMEVSMIGSYDSMRQFTSALHRMDRLQGVTFASFKNYAPEDKVLQIVQADDAALGQREGLLIGEINLSFAYVDDVMIPRGADGSIFEEGIEMEPIRILAEQRTSAPTLDMSNTGRSNPFINE